MAATEVLTATSADGYWSSIKAAADVVRGGGIVAFPTETVYGLAASAEQPDAIQRLRQIKDRIAEVPLTVHIGRREQAVDFLSKPPGPVRRLIARAWPGPLTIVFRVDDPSATPIAANHSEEFLKRIYSEGTVGIRCPDHQVACDFLDEVGEVVQATSANPRGAAPALTIDEVVGGLDGQIDLAIDGGPARYGAASTIVRVSGRDIEVLREGVLERRVVERFMRTTILLLCTGNTCRSPMAEVMLKAQLAERLDCAVVDLPSRGFKIGSAGTFASDGAPATPEAVAATRMRDLDLSGHRSTRVTPQLLDTADIILTMTRSHLAQVAALAPAVAERARTLLPNQDIADPIGGSAEEYTACLDQISAGLAAQVQEAIL